MTWLKNGVLTTDYPHDGSRAATHSARVTEEAVKDIWRAISQVEGFTDPQYRAQLVKTLGEAASYLSMDDVEQKNESKKG